MRVTNHPNVMRLWQGLSAVLLLIFAVGAQTALAQELSAIARLDAAAVVLADTGEAVEIVLPLSQAVPWRVRLLDMPPRLIMDFREVDFAGIAAVAVKTDRIKAVRAGIFRPGWSRLVLELAGPYRVDLAEMQTKAGKARVEVRLVATDTISFAKLASAPEPGEWVPPKTVETAPPAKPEGGPLVVVIDAGHGGIDPGAERNGQTEAKLILGFARQLAELLRREGLFKVVMTRNDDVFVPLEARISIARAQQADAFISLHADALEEGEAVGAVIYTLSDEASDAAAETLAERHDRDDLLAGVNLAGQDDLVATVLMDMARTETAPRTARLATALQEAMASSALKMHRLPLQSAGFSVLKSPDIPSVLIELGFMSSARDLARLTDKKWRNKMAEAIRDGLMIWAQEDAALQGLRRR